MDSSPNKPIDILEAMRHDEQAPGAPGPDEVIWRRRPTLVEVDRVCGLTYRGDSASGRDGADGASALAEGVPEHVVEVSVRDEQKECNRNTMQLRGGENAGG